VKIFPLSDLILLPLVPTIVPAIADYLRSITCSHDINSIPQAGVDAVSKLAQDWSWQWQFQRSIRQVPTLQYQYVSTIAHQLAAKSTLTAVEICQSLYPLVLNQTFDLSCYMQWYCWYNTAGYIYFQPTPESILTWLNYIQDLPIDSLRTEGNFAAIGSIDLAIYAHARCCSLLKLADAEKLVVITANWQISTPNWLLTVTRTQNHLTPSSNHIFDYPVEQRLVQALMTVLDCLYGDNGSLRSSQSTSRHQKSPNWTKLTINLAQSWLEFDRHCQVFGDTKRQNPDLAIARCGLTVITRRYLQVLLENYLGAQALVEL
jgi:hypothetical protein